jgi:hypothetical protein
VGGGGDEERGVMSEIKAIETKYKGYRFRSRLEAKWAVFFDALGIEWEYEKEGYVLPDGTWYLPDFWLPLVRMWAEVKPTAFSLKELEKAKALALGTGYDCLLLIGVPQNKPYMGTDGWGYCLTHYKCYPEMEHRFVFVTPDGHGGFCEGEEFIRHDDTENAATAARSARFEHGESGAK